MGCVEGLELQSPENIDHMLLMGEVACLPDAYVPPKFVKIFDILWLPWVHHNFVT